MSGQWTGRRRTGHGGRWFLWLGATVAVLCLLGGCGIGTSTEGRVGEAVARSSAPAGSRAAGTPLTLDGLPRGRDPRIVYLSGRTLVTPDGRTVSIGRWRYDWVTPYAGGWLAGSTGEDMQRFLDRDGRILRSRPGSKAVVDRSGSQVAYVTAAESLTHRPELVIAPTIGAESAKLRIPVAADATPVGFLSDDTVVFHTGSPARVFVARFHHTRTRVPGLVQGASTTERGLVAGTTKITTYGSCSAVLDADGFHRLWKTCAFSLEHFSPDARHVLATDAYRDGLGLTELAVLHSRTGAVSARATKRGRAEVHVNQMVWEDDRHVLASVYDTGRWALVRLDLRGHLELATDPVRAPDTDCPLFFSLRP